MLQNNNGLYISLDENIVHRYILNESILGQHRTIAKIRKM